MRGEDVPFYTTSGAASTYKTKVGIGSPPTFYTLVVDTGSANTWIGACKSHPFIPTKTSQQTSISLDIKYGTGEFHGKFWYDRVTLGRLVIENQGIGVAECTSGLDDDIDGILGLGLTELTKDSLVRDGGNYLEVIPTVTDNLFAQGLIEQRTVALSFDCMSTTIESIDYTGMFKGIMTFGGTDPARYSGEITYVPIPPDRPSSKHWSVEQKIFYGSAKDKLAILHGGIGVLDAGTSLIHLGPSSFRAYTSASGAEYDDSTGLISISEEYTAELKSLFFEIGGRTFELPPHAQIWPQTLNNVAGGQEDTAYLVLTDLFNDNGVQISSINGFTWLQYFYIILDSDNKRIGIADANFMDSRPISIKTADFSSVPTTPRGQMCAGCSIM